MPFWNPYAEEFIRCGAAAPTLSDLFAFLERKDPFHLDKRDELIGKYAFAVPNDEAIRCLVSLSPLVEVGAGSGYWAEVLSRAGADVVCCDNMTATYYRISKLWQEKPWHAVERADGSEFARLHSDRTLIMVWPPYQNSLAREALKAYLDAGGRRFVYVGEYDGCTADKGFEDYLCRRCREVQSLNIPSWPGMHDYLRVFEARAPRKRAARCPIS